MCADKKRLVYSTDPEPNSAPKTPELPANPAAPIPTLQQNNPVRVYLERKGRRGKTVSIIKGVMSPKKGKQALVKLLKNKLGSGGAIKGDEIEIQGDHREAIVTILNNLGYKAKQAGG